MQADEEAKKNKGKKKPVVERKSEDAGVVLGKRPSFSYDESASNPLAKLVIKKPVDLLSSLIQDQDLKVEQQQRKRDNKELVKEEEQMSKVVI
jgi:hypothetical protein